MSWLEVLQYATRHDPGRIVIYSEGPSTWAHLKPMVFELLEMPGESITFLTSTPTDPGLNELPRKVTKLQIGHGVLRRIALRSLNAAVVVTSSPDLGKSYFPKSRQVSYYAYVHHSLVSTHMAYHADAFDHFDVIFCAGPHHCNETRARERRHGLRQKTLVRYGSGRIDCMARMAAAQPASTAEKPTILVAPSWGGQGLFETAGGPILSALAETGHNVIARPHPESVKRSPKALAALMRAFDDHPRVQFDLESPSMASFLSARLLVSDWSGAAFEFAFATGRPVLFWDGPFKCRNPDFRELALEPLEIAAREELGAVFAPENIARLPHTVTSLLRTSAFRPPSDNEAAQRHLYNVGRSAGVTRATVESLLQPGLVNEADNGV
jgi:hypothetical protein